MNLLRFLLCGSLVIVGSTVPLAAQTESSRSLLIYVSPTAEKVNLSASEHLLVFHMPVQIPGASLPPGPYIFRLVAPSVVQVINATRSTIYSTFMTLSASGEGDTSRERIRFEQMEMDDAPRIVGWYLPGGVGYEFVYPKPKRKAG
jgi:hypothetical protein